MPEIATEEPSAMDDQRQAVVDAAVAEISHIATLPEVTMKIIKLVEDPDATAQDLNDVISHDPALGARILKVVNSAFYGLPGQIGSINRAIVLLGMNAVKNIAIAASLSKLFRGGQLCPQFNAKDLWTHCIAVAACSRLLAKKAGSLVPDEAFLAGLIHDLGLMVEMQADRAHFVQVFQQLDGTAKMRDVEVKLLGANHEDFGFGLTRSWKFPPAFQYVCGFHHRPEDLDLNIHKLPAIVHIADVMAARADLGFKGSVELEAPNPAAMEVFGFSEADLEEILADLPDAVDEASSLMQE